MKYSPLLRLSGGLMLWALPTMAWAADAGGTGVLAGVGGGLLVVGAVVIAARPYGMFLAAFAGIGVSAYLAYEHHQVGSTVCDVSSAVSCSNVIKSEYGEIAGVPVALFGVGYFLAMSWLASRYAFQQKAGALALLQVGAVLGVAADVYFGWAMTQVGSLCPFCASTYVLNLVLLVGSSLERRGKEDGFFQALPAEGGPAVVIGLAGLIFGLMATGGSGKSEAAAGGGKTGATSLVGMYELPAGTVRYEPNDPVKGNPEAKFVLVEW
ncbi:MAG TPA: vitamin K epoxide reductase family protein, partial [Myxococcota bacterium]|nr:vitamin K epoxide reductase family protein [Myxococcota bacterium]